MGDNYLFNICFKNPAIFMQKMRLSRCEFKVLLQHTLGKSNLESAVSLGVAIGTVKFHKTSILKKHNCVRMDQVLIILSNIAIAELIKKYRKNE